MDSNSRDRSPFKNRAAGGQSLMDPSFSASDSLHYQDSTTSGAAAAFPNNPSFDFQQPQFSLDNTFDDLQPHDDPQQLHAQTSHTIENFTAADFSNSDFFPSNTNNHISPPPTTGTLSHTASPAPETFPSFEYDPASLDPALLNDVDLLQPTALDNPGGQLDHMSATAMSHHSPTPPHLLPGMSSRNSASPSPRASPGAQQSPFASFTRPRNASESLDPSSAAFPQGHVGEWGQSNLYRGHRRAPSDTLSEISNHSNQVSPYLGTLDSFDANNQSSPMLNASQDPTFSDALGIGQFTLNDTQSYHSPAHSPHISPRLVPTQQPLPAFTVDNNFGLNAPMNGAFTPNQPGLDMFPNLQHEPFPALNGHGQSPSLGIDMGQADHMSPPEINIITAPPSKPLEPVGPVNHDDSLGPPTRHRPRAKSDSHAGSRPATPSLPARGRSPSLQPNLTDSLSPFDGGSNPSSRASSPRGRNGSLGSRVRSSSATSDPNSFALDLANPDRTSPSNGGERGRIQKHPATFQCHLCPKRFTRAYNLRSHLRTHTDERPFVCTVCGKAFARQHDRKRHEGLHSGEKKFVCRGTLQSSSQWGCGRRFARADALGRHFRSEAGRVCIKPLLDEEAAERQKVWLEEQQQAQVAAGFVAPQPMMGRDMPGSFLPAALLQQYPALAGIDWTAIPQGNPPIEEEYSGRSSFDASSGGEMYDELSENEYADQGMGGVDMGMNQPYAVHQPQHHQQQPQLGLYGNHQMGDFANNFEGR